MSKPFAPKRVKSVNLQNAVHAYVSDCCNVLAEKPACKDNGGALGTWRCSQCRRVAKVRPTSKTPFTTKKVEPVQGEVAL
jgi:hypothetical protein